ncbi:MAG: ABC transporter ATP-binding protein [Planctomycetes bacterium]|nr:ABC transporter ATP-binding protein [Planctomycetota bacterium]
MSEKGIEITGLRKCYRRGGETLQVLDGVDLSARKGEFIALTGPSGSGKSTILNFLGGLDLPDEGLVIVGDTEVTALSASELADWRSRSVGFVFQAFNLIPVLSALENVELPLLRQPLKKAERREHARYALEIVGLADRMTHRPQQLSGGQEQRCAIARAIVTDPDIILADEPTGDLDRASGKQVLDILGRLAKEMSKTIVMVTHDPEAAAYADRNLRLESGRIVEAARA